MSKKRFVPMLLLFFVAGCTVADRGARQSSDLLPDNGRKEFSKAEIFPLIDIIENIKRNERLVNNISYDYSIEYRSSERLKSIHRLPTEAAVQGGIAAATGATVTTGTFRGEGDRFFLSSETLSVPDNKTLRKQISSFDGTTFISLDLHNNRGIKSHAPHGMANFHAPQFIPYAFLSWRTLYDVLSDEKTLVKTEGLEEIDGVVCYKLILDIPFSNVEGNFVSRKIVWIDASRGFTMKKALSFSHRMERPLTVTRFTPVELPGGIWSYREVIFESDRPGLPPGPHTTVKLSVGDIAVNKELGKDAFKADANQVRIIHDAR